MKNAEIGSMLWFVSRKISFSVNIQTLTQYVVCVWGTHFSPYLQFVQYGFITAWQGNKQLEVYKTALKMLQERKLPN